MYMYMYMQLYMHMCPLLDRPHHQDLIEALDAATVQAEDTDRPPRQPRRGPVAIGPLVGGGGPETIGQCGGTA